MSNKKELTYPQSKAIADLINNTDKQVIFCANPGCGKLYTLAYFLHITTFGNSEHFCIVYDKLTFVTDFKKQLANFFDNVDDIIFIQRNKYVAKEHIKNLYIISTSPIETLSTTKNIIIGDITNNNIITNCKLKNITINPDEIEPSEVKEIHEFLKNTIETEEGRQFILKNMAEYLCPTSPFKFTNLTGDNSKVVLYPSNKNI